MSRCDPKQIKAVNARGGFGKWTSGVCLNPSNLPTKIKAAADGPPA